MFLITYAILGNLPRKIKKSAKNKQHKFVVFIPGYKEDAVIFEVAKEVLNQSYPKKLFDVIVIADSFQQKTLDDLNSLPIIVKEVSFDKSTKAKALNKTMAELPENLYDIALILDADNVLAPDFITKINDSFNAGYQVVQGHRAAKNTKGAFAMLDAMSEEINNNIYSKGHRAIGLSSGLVGSGMAISYHLYKNTMGKIDSVAEDKELELNLLKRGYKIEYRDDALCYDEKVSNAKVFYNQRRRWITTQYHYFKTDFLTAFWHLITKGNVDYFDKAIQFIQPPRILLLGAVILFGVGFVLANYFLDNQFPYTNYWIILFTSCILSFIFSVPRSFYNLKTLGALASLPKGMLMMLLSLLKIKGANKTFIHTQHTSNSEEVSFK